MIVAGCKTVLRPVQRRWLAPSRTGRCTSNFSSHSRRHAARAALPPRPEDLIVQLQSMDDETLMDWAVANRATLTLELLASIAEVQAAAEAEERGRLWALGSKLMAVREGLVPVSNEVLQEELRAAAQRACLPLGAPAPAALPSSRPLETNAHPSSSSSTNSSSSSREDGSSSAAADAADVEEQLVLHSPPQQQQQQQPAQAQALSFLVQRTAQLGLTPEGLTLLQQQAAGLEVVVGSSKARSLAEVIGRKEISPAEQLEGLFEVDAASRILQLLVSMPDREERAALLPEAFTPIPEAEGAPTGEPAAHGSACVDAIEDEELLSTTPLALLQAIDLQLSRLSRPPQQWQAAGVAGLLAGGPGDFGDLPPGELAVRLQELRADVAAYWGEAGNTSGEEW